MRFRSLLGISLSLSKLSNALPVVVEGNETSCVEKEVKTDLLECDFDSNFTVLDEIFDSEESEDYAVEAIINYADGDNERKRKHYDIEEPIFESNQKDKYIYSNVVSANMLVQSNQQARFDDRNELLEEHVARLEEWFEIRNRENQVEVIQKDNIDIGAQSHHSLERPSGNVDIIPGKNFWHTLSIDRNIESEFIPNSLETSMIENSSFDVDMNAQNADGDTPLHIATRKNDVQLVQFFIRMGVDTNKKNCWSDSPLKIAVLDNNLTMIDVLIEGGATVNEERSDLLVFSIERSHDSTVRHLIDMGMDVRLKTKDQKTALHIAVPLDNTDLVKLLLNLGVNPLEMDANNKTAFDYCKNESMRNLIRPFLLKAPKKLSTKEKTSKLPRGKKNLLLHHSYTSSLFLDNMIGDSPIHTAVHINYLHIVSRLISQKTDINQVNLQKETPLIIAIKNRDKIMAAFLIEKGAIMNPVGRNQEIPLWIAIRIGSLDLVQILLQYGADVNYVDFDSKTPLHIAVDVGHLQIVDLLLKYGANHLAHDDLGNTPIDYAKKNSKLKQFILSFPNLESDVRMSPFALHKAVRLGNIEEIKKLLASGAELNIKDAGSETPLSIAIGNKLTEIMTLLITSGADINSVSKSEETPLSLAVQNSNLALVKILIDKKVNCNVLTNNYAPLFIAVRQRNLEIVKVLLSGGAAVNQLNYKNQTALHAAVELKWKEGIVALLNAGGNSYARDKDKNSPFDLAKHSPEIYSILSSHRKKGIIDVSSSK